MKHLIFFIKWFFILLAVLFTSALIYVNVNKQELITQVTKELGKSINGKVNVDDVEISFFKSFPHFSVLLTNVNIIDSAFESHHNKFFNCEKVFARISVINIILKKPFIKAMSLENGKLYFYTREDGYSNTYLLKSKNKDAGNGKNNNQSIDKVILKNFEIVVDQKDSRKFHDVYFEDMTAKLKREGSFLKIDIKNEMLVKSLVFNKKKGSFVKSKEVSGNFLINFNTESEVLSFDKIKLKIDRHPFIFSGNFQMKGNDRQFKLHVETKDAIYSFLTALLPEKLEKSLSIVNLEKPFSIYADVEGPLSGGEPKVYAAWEVKNSNMQTNFMDFTDASFNGYFTNEVVVGLERDDPNSKIVVNDFIAKWNGLPVTSPSIEILNLYTPLLTANINSTFPLKSLNEVMASNVLLFKDGVGVMDLNYSGPVEKNDNTNSFLNGNVDISNGLLTYLPRSVDMTKVSSKILFKDSDIFISNLSTEVLGQKIIMNGEGKKLLSLINSAPQKAVVNWNIYSPSLNLTPFSFLLQEKKKTTSSKKGIIVTANKIDNILENATLDVSFKSPKIKYKNFIAENVEAKIILLPDMYSLKNISMRHAGGNLNLTGSVTGLNKNRHELNLDANFTGVNVKKVFYSFDNFGQTAILSDNLEGKLTAKIKANAVLDKEGKISPESINSLVDFSLKDGSLINYEPIKKIQQFVFKKRDFDNIKFAELKDKLEIKNGDVKIDKMEIQSTVLTLIVQGLYSNKGNSDISIQVPLSNLKKRAKDFDPENKGVDKKFGTSVFLRGKTGSDGNIEFKLDLFNKFKKEKEKGN